MYRGTTEAALDWRFSAPRRSRAESEQARRRREGQGRRHDRRRPAPSSRTSRVALRPVAHGAHGRRRRAGRGPPPGRSGVTRPGTGTASSVEPSGPSSRSGREELTAARVDRGEHEPAPGPATAARASRTSRLVAPTTPRPERLGQALGGGDPDAQAGEQSRPDVDRRRLQVRRRQADLAQEVLSGGVSVSTWRRRPVKRELRLDAVGGAHRHPDRLGRRLDAPSEATGPPP